ncbi:hypothetical protein ACH4CE_17400 [Streptomyces gelaticus]|uniref:hypothetical protein n=1 Tax=Streptomyces gelaticus TaxID=285446 RepID=UPI00379DF011
MVQPLSWRPVTTMRGVRPGLSCDVVALCRQPADVSRAAARDAMSAALTCVGRFPVKNSAAYW